MLVAVLEAEVTWFWGNNGMSGCRQAAALMRRVLENTRFQQGGIWFRRIAGVAISCLGGYFIVQPFVGGV